jgi:RNA polymerase sigma factor (sigma-70 family)
MTRQAQPKTRAPAAGEAELLVRVRAGDAAALNAIVESWTAYARAAARRVTLPHPWGFDEAFDYALNAVADAARGYRPKLGEFRAYVAGMIGYALLNCVEHYSRHKMTAGASSSEDPEFLLAHLADRRRHPAEQAAAVDALLAPLNAFHRHLVRRVAIEECTFADVARELRRHPDNIRVHYRRAIDILRARTIPALAT